MQLRVRVPALALVADLVLCAGAQAQDKGKSVDCADISMKFAAPSFSVKCTETAM